MTSYLTLDFLCAATPDRRILFEGLNLSVGVERVGLVGRNGAGKSTLLRIITGEAMPASGSLTRSGSIGTLAQDWPAALTVAEALGVADALAVIARIVAGEGSEDDFEAADWSIEARIEAALAEVGLAELPLDRRIGSLSGGERTRIGIARLRIETPDLLLLDEPTNNLDAAGRAALTHLIADWRGGVMVASHDRTLLDQMDRIVELTPIGVRVFGGNWSAFAEAREAERARAAAELERAEAGLRASKGEMQAEREAKDRRDKAGRAFAARGSEPKILLGKKAERAENSGARGRRVSQRLVADAAERATAARERVEILTPLTIELPPSGVPAQAELLRMEKAVLRVGERLLGPWSLTLRGPERIALVGANGTGKTSLLRVASGEAIPETGHVRRAEGRVAMLDQHVAMLDPEESVLDNFRRINPGMDRETAHAACARFAFRNRDALRLAGTLSGGERLRAGLACTLAGERPPWLLLLDEPTNHLDVESVEILERALIDYDGGLLVVSHDPAFLDAIGIEREVRLNGARHGANTGG